MRVHGKSHQRCVFENGDVFGCSSLEVWIQSSIEMAKSHLPPEIIAHRQRSITRVLINSGDSSVSASSLSVATATSIKQADVAGVAELAVFYYNQAVAAPDGAGEFHSFLLVRSL